jgi:signal transduction histidine kinase
VQAAYDGHEGLRRAEQCAPDLILTDLMMPGMSGDELLSRLRADARYDHVPVVVLTAKADDALRLSLLQHGAQDYVMKPFSERELEARIGNLIAVKRTREVLRAELQSQASDLEVLARELVHNRKALRAAVEAANEARDQAARESRAKSDFLSMISHEMRTPLTAMLLLLENLRSHQDNLTEHQKDRLRRVIASAQRFSHLVDSLLQQQRLTSGRVERKVVSFSFPRLVKEVRDEVLPLIEQKGLTFEVEVPDELAPLHSDPTLVRLILVNLLGNATKFTPQGKIALSAAQTEAGLRVVVSDSGVGIAEADQERVFAAFEQLEEVVTKSKPGVGLGLALVRSITELLGGRVELWSRLGHGSAFAVTLPDLEPEPAVKGAARDA